MPRLGEGETVGRYRVAAFIAAGGMGEVYRATDVDSGRDVALKLLAGSAERRFARERAIAATLDHPRIVPVYDTGVDDAGRAYIAMRLIEGGDLAAVLAAGPLRLERALDLLGQVADALDAAHDLGLVHRDVKPANVLIEEHDGVETAFLSDFGLVRELVASDGASTSGALLGTADYMPPELVHAGTSDARGDVYALGCLLFEMLSGRVPYPRDSEVATVWAHLNEDPPSLADVAPGLPPGLDAVLARALAKEPEQRYASAGDLAAAAREAAGGALVVAGERPTVRPGAAACPYKGLEAFAAADADFFFGREDLVAEIVARLGEAGVVTIVGASGSGKSSLVRAGLVPALGTAASLIVPGERPLVALAGAGADGVLVVDQLEELFTLCGDEPERRAFVDRVLAGPRPAVIVLRADFYARCAQYPELRAALGRSQVFVGPMSESSLREAIVKPAQRVGLHLEHRLLETVVRDVAGQPAALPLMSHAMLETWNRRLGRTLTLAGYLQAGGVDGAIAATAETLYESLEAQDRRLARSIFLRLAALGDGTEDTRRRVDVAELLLRPEDEGRVRALLDRLARARLITLDEGTAEMAHEALIRHWPTLQAWLDDDRDGRRLHRRLTEAAGEWDALGRDAGLLWRGGRLSSAVEWAATQAGELNATEREFLAASVAAERSELVAVRRRNRRLRLLVAALAALLVAAAVAVVVAVRQTDAARTQGARATAQARAATEQERIALSRGLAGQAQALLGRRVDLALLVALEADRTEQTAESRDALVAAIQRTSGLEAILSGDEASARSVAISADDRTIAVLDVGGRLSVWDVASRRLAGPPILVPTSDPLVAPSAALSPDGAFATALIHQHAAVVVDLRHRDAPLVYVGPPLDDDLRALAFSADGSHVVAVGRRFAGVRDAGARASSAVLLDWDVGTPLPLDPASRFGGFSATAYVAGEFPLGAVLSATGTTAALADPKRVVVVDTASGRTLRTIDVTVASSAGRPLLALSADGHRLAAVDARSAVGIWDLATGDSTAAAVPSGGVGAVRFSADGGQLLVGYVDGDVAVVDAATGAPVGVESRVHVGAVTDLAVSAGHVVSTGADGLLTLQAAGGQEAIERVLAASASDGVAVPSPDGMRVAIGRADGSVELVAARDGARSALVRGPPGDLALAFDRSGRALTIAGGDGQVRRVDLAAAGAPSRGLGPYTGAPLAVAADGGYVVGWGGNDTGDVFVLSPPGRAAAEPFIAPLPKRPLAAAFSPNADRLAVGFSDGVVDILDPARPATAEAVLRGPAGGVNDVAYSPDGRLLATVDADGTLRFWNAVSGEADGVALSGGSRALTAVAFLADGKVVATLGSDVLRLWDVERRVPLGDGLALPLEAGSDDVQAMPPDAAVVVWRDLVLRLGDLLWTDDRGRLADRVCQVVGRSLTEAEFRQLVPGATYRAQCQGTSPA